MGDLSKSQCGDRTADLTSQSMAGVGPLRRTGLSGAGEGTTVTRAKTCGGGSSSTGISLSGMKASSGGY
jgi:hypothetical protein